MMRTSFNPSPINFANLGRVSQSVKQSLAADNIVGSYQTSGKSSFNPDEFVNSHGMKGMYIGGGRDWRTIIPVSDEVKQKLEKVVKDDFIATYGKAIPEGSKRNDVIVGYLGTISAENRSPASWTLTQMAGEYATRLEALVKAQNPNWKPGEVFDTGMLDQLDKTLGSGGINIKA